MRLLAFLLLVLCLPDVQAQGCGAGFGNAGGRLTYTSSGGQVTALPRITDAAFRQAWSGTLELSGGAVRATGQVAAAVGTGAAAASACMNVARSIPLAQVARGAARALPVVGTGIVLVDIANTIRCRGTNQSVLYGAGLECDAGLPQEQISTGLFTEYENGTTGQWQSLQQAQAWCGSHYGQGWTFFEASLRCGATLASSYNNGNPWNTRQYSGNRCPDGLRASTLGGIPFCPGGVYTPATQQQVADRIASTDAFTADPAAVAGEAMERGHDYTPEASSPAELSGPASVNGPTTTTTTTTGGGAPATRTQTPAHSITYAGDSYSYTTNITTIEGDTTTVTNQAPEIEVCGLPGTPPCKIDETGTPTTAQMAAAQAALDEAAAQLRDKVTEQSTPRALPWLWGGISMPAGACTNLVAPSPHASIPDGEIDLCGQPWVAWWRAAWAVFCGIWCVAYCWRRFSDTVEGSAA